MKKIILILILFLAFPIFCQELNFKSFTSEDGLSNNSVNAIENDKSGALWIATWDGLNYFDGKTFSFFKNDINNPASIGGNEIKKVLRDKNDIIWILTNESVSRYAGKGKFINYSIKNIEDLFLNASKEISIKLTYQTYLIFDGKNFVSTNETIKKEEKEWLIFKKILLSKHPNIIINDFLIDKNTVYFATKLNGLFILKIKNGQYEITQYRKGNTKTSGFKSNEIEKIHKDAFGSIWLAFKDGGISLLQKSNKGISVIFNSHHKNNTLPNETVRAITKDNNNDLWVGFYSKGLYKQNSNSSKFSKIEITKAQTNSNWNKIRSLFTDTKGIVWVGTYAGIIRIEDSNIRYFSANNYENFPNNRNYSFYQDNETLWIGCWGGIAKLNLKTLLFEEIPFNNKLKSLNVRNITKIEDELIIGTENNSLLLFNLLNGDLTKITKEDNLLSNSIFSTIQLKSNENLWIATLGGISILNNKRKVIKNISENEGLASHLVYGLLKVDDKIWANTTKGISIIDTTNYEIKNINLKSWQEQEFSEGAYSKDKNNLLYYGGINGLLSINPKNIEIENYTPKLDIKIDNLNEYNSVEKNYSKNYFKATINSIAFEKTPNNKILYKLVNHDETWRTLNKNNVIFYKNLKSGKYQFLVKNSSEEKITGNYNVVIKKPFYLSNWFTILIISLLASGIIIFLYTKNKVSLRFQNKLQNEVKTRTETIENQKNELQKIHNQLKDNNFEVDNFKQYIVKEFKQPLNTTLTNISEINIYPQKKEVVSNQIKELLNKIIQWEYLDETHSLQNTNPSIISTEFIKNYIDSFKNEFEKNNAKLLTSFNTDTKYIEIDVIQYKLCIQYLIQVFLKYIKENSTIQCSTTIQNQKFLLKLSTENTLLANSINEIEKYNFYYKAFKSLIKNINLKFSKTITNNHIVFSVSSKINYPETDAFPTLFKKDITDVSNLPDNKKIILVHSNKNNFSVVKNLLQNENFHLVFKDDIKEVSKYLSKTNVFNLVIFYNTTLSSDFIKLSKFIHQSNPIATLYISERIDFYNQEEIQNYNIDEVIQLPISKKLLYNKITSLLNIRKYDESNNSVQKNTSINERYINDALKIIESHYSNTEFNVEFLTEKLKISRVKCYRIFKEVVHQTPSDFINNFRMKKALELLKQKELNISQVAFECGFNDPKYFSKAFKKFYGKPPKKFIKEA